MEGAACTSGRQGGGEEDRERRPQGRSGEAGSEAEMDTAGAVDAGLLLLVLVHGRLLRWRRWCRVAGGEGWFVERARESKDLGKFGAEKGSAGEGPHVSGGPRILWRIF